jgi:ribosome-binding factor A
MASEQRVARIREEIRRDASEVISKMKDPRLGFVTVTDAEVTRDLRYVRIFVSVLGDAEAVEKTMIALQSGIGFIRSELGQRLKLRHTPEITFKLDESVQRGASIEALIAQIHNQPE